MRSTEIYMCPTVINIIRELCGLRVKHVFVMLKNNNDICQHLPGISVEKVSYYISILYIFRLFILVFLMFCLVLLNLLQYA